MWAEVAGTEEGQRVAGPVKTELTYIDLTENNVYYAANHNQGVEYVPGISKIALNEVERAVGKLDAAQTKSFYSHIEIYIHLCW